MKITILEAATISKGDVSFDGLRELGEVTEYPLTPTDKIVQNVGDAEIVLCNKTPFTEDVLRACPNIKYIGLCATGYNNIDLKTCRELGITVCNVPAYSSAAVAQQVFAFILNFYSRVSEYDDFVQGGGWLKSETFSDFVFPTKEISGKTLGIIGYGSIGRKVANIARAFGMSVIVNTRTAKQDSSVRFADVKEVFAEADIITVHCPLTEETKGLINKENLALCKPSCIIINTSRGAVVNEYDLAEALNNGRIAAAALDVLTEEPMSADCPLIGAKNCVITPHVAWAALETRERLVKAVTENVRAFIAGKPINIVTE